MNMDITSSLPEARIDDERAVHEGLVRVVDDAQVHDDVQPRQPFRNIEGVYVPSEDVAPRHDPHEVLVRERRLVPADEPPLRRRQPAVREKQETRLRGEWRRADGCNDGVSPSSCSSRRKTTIGEALHPAYAMPEGRKEIPRRGLYRFSLQKQQQEEDRRKQSGVFAERRR